MDNNFWTMRLSQFWMSMYRQYIKEEYNRDNAYMYADRDLELFKKRIESGDFMLDNNDNE